MATLEMSNELRRRLEDWATRGYPFETCGLLIGTQQGDRVQVLELTLARNVDTQRARDRYDMAPEDMVSADELARSLDLDIVGVWHTHPDHPALPSETDREHAWSGWSYVIAAVTKDGVQDLRSWRLGGEGFVEETITP